MVVRARLQGDADVQQPLTAEGVHAELFTRLIARQHGVQVVDAQAIQCNQHIAAR